MNCKICNSNSNHFLDSTIFKEKQPIAYYKCTSCGFIQTEEPYWLEKAYSSVIAKTDIGLISRNIVFSDLTESILNHFFADTKKALDYGAGFGMFVRIMRDKGYNFLWYDDYCQNIFAETFEGSLSEKYDVLTAYEVFEHLPDPIDVLEKLLNLSDTIIFSTVLNDGIDDFNAWWYRAEASGQHISFHSTRSLQYLAKKYNLNYYHANGKTLHVFTKKTLNELHFNLLFNTNDTRANRLKRMLMIKPFKKKESLLQSDFDRLIKKQLLNT